MKTEELKEIFRDVVRDEIKNINHTESSCNHPIVMDEKQHALEHAFIKEWMDFFQKINNMKWLVPRTIVKVVTSIVITAIVVTMLSYFGLKVVATGGIN